ncbi:unnamed protein product [Rhizoctonia solani]|uniref:Fe2OG dioxygenase domain-containing protein n=1 Tax=Rhizoctonia solani TaxID=456999 RepID=A0A8H3I108_9AGAM|nr:unnamed protein product [Rhizoctonia solani]
MRLLHYPAQAEVISDQKPGLGSHTDFEVRTYFLSITIFNTFFEFPQCFTILWQDEVPALQVKNATGQWVDAQPIPGTFIINIGDQLSRWTNDIFKSTVHRVINKSGVQRYSIPLFFSIDHDVKVEVLPSCISDNRPARYEPIIAGDYVKSNLEKTYAYLP